MQNDSFGGQVCFGGFAETEATYRSKSETPDSVVTVNGFATGLSLAYPLRSSTASIGGTAKLISQQLDIQNVFGIAADLGM